LRRAKLRPTVSSVLMCDMPFEAMTTAIAFLTLSEPTSEMHAYTGFSVVLRMNVSLLFGAIKAMPPSRLAVVMLTSVWQLATLALLSWRWRDCAYELFWVSVVVSAISVVDVSRRMYRLCRASAQPDLNALARARVAEVEIGGVAYPYAVVARGARTDTTTCAICMLDYLLGETVRRLACSHSFHEACLREWLRRGPGDCRCPMRCGEQPGALAPAWCESQADACETKDGPGLRAATCGEGGRASLLGNCHCPGLCLRRRRPERHVETAEFPCGVVPERPPPV